jgi:Cytochrome c554 and c-prime
LGGLSKKAYKTNEIKDFHQLPVLNVDGGGLLFKEERLLPALLLQSKITAEGIIDAYNLMKIDAVGVSKRDLAGGLAFLQEQAKRSNFKWLSANLVRKSTLVPLFKASTITEVGPHKVGIIGLTNPEPPFAFEEKDDAVILPWQEILPKLVAEMTPRCDMLILLSNNNSGQNKEIAETFKDIHIIIQAMPTKRNSPPNLVNNTLTFQAGKQGKYLGWMLVDWQDSHTWGSGALRSRISQKKQELDGLNGRIKRYEKRFSQEDLASHQSYQRLLEKRDNSIFIISGLEMEMDKMDIEGLAPSTYENNFVELVTNIPDQPDVLKVVETTKQKVNEAGRAKARAAKKKTAQSTENVSTDSLTGWQVCAKCHAVQTTFWKSTNHYKAFQTLVDSGQQYNLNCLPCHVTSSQDLSSATNGSEILSLPAVLQQVGCEVCHGPGNKHAANPGPGNIVRKPPETTCRRCHTPARDETFSYEDDLQLIACPPDAN